MKRKITILIIALLPAFGCSPPENPKLEFSFHVNKVDSVMPSYQIAIWLEKPGGEYVKTFFVCDYLSYGGFNIPEICPDWVKKAQWGDAPQEMVDAVTQATPDIGNVSFEFDCPKEEVPYGEYKYCIEIHITEDYNELYTGGIEIKRSGASTVSKAVVTYLPERCPEASGLLSKVEVVYKN